MSSTSLNSVNTKYLTKSLSKNDGSEQSDGYSVSAQGTEDGSSLGSTERNSINDNSASTGSVGIKISPISTAVNSINEKIESFIELENIETSTKRLQTESDSFNSHTQSNYNEKFDSDSNKVIGGQLDGDLYLPLAEEQDANINARGNNESWIKKGFGSKADPIESLVSATLAFREASHNQCDLLRAQTSAINRLATAIEDQNVMMSRFNTIVQRTGINDKNFSDNGGHSREDKQ